MSLFKLYDFNIDFDLFCVLFLFYSRYLVLYFEMVFSDLGFLPIYSFFLFFLCLGNPHIYYFCLNVFYYNCIIGFNNLMCCKFLYNHLFLILSLQHFLLLTYWYLILINFELVNYFSVYILEDTSIQIFQKL